MMIKDILVHGFQMMNESRKLSNYHEEQWNKLDKNEAISESEIMMLICHHITWNEKTYFRDLRETIEMRLIRNNTTQEKIQLAVKIMNSFRISHEQDRIINTRLLRERKTMLKRNKVIRTYRVSRKKVYQFERLISI